MSLGVFPLVIGQGAGAEMRRSLGTAVFSGMIGVTVFGIFLTPLFYCVIQWMTGGTTPPKGSPAMPATKEPASHIDGVAQAISTGIRTPE